MAGEGGGAPPCGRGRVEERSRREPDPATTPPDPTSMAVPWWEEGGVPRHGGRGSRGTSMVREGGGALPWWERGAGRGRRRRARRVSAGEGGEGEGGGVAVVGEEKEREEAPTHLVKMRRLRR